MWSRPNFLEHQEVEESNTKEDDSSGTEFLSKHGEESRRNARKSGISEQDGRHKL